PNDITMLRQQGVSDAVIAAMQARRTPPPGTVRVRPVSNVVIYEPPPPPIAVGFGWGYGGYRHRGWWVIKVTGSRNCGTGLCPFNFFTRTGQRPVKDPSHSELIFLRRLRRQWPTRCRASRCRARVAPVRPHTLARRDGLGQIRASALPCTGRKGHRC